MVTNPYVDFMVEDPYQKAQREAEQRAMLAQLLEQQAFQPFESRPAPISRTEGISKLLAAGLAGLTKRQQRDAEQKAREADLESAINQLDRISRPTEEVSIEEMFGMPKEDVGRVKAVPGQLDINVTAPKLDVSPTGEVTGYTPSEFGDVDVPALRYGLPEMTKEQKRAGYIRMLGGGPISQAFGQQGITDLMKTPQYADIAAPSAKDFTPASLAEYRKSGDPSLLVRAESPESKISLGTPGFENFTTESLAKYQISGDPRDLVAKPKAPKEVDQGSVDARRFRQEDALRTGFENQIKPYVEEIDATSKILDVAAAIPPGQRPDPTTQQAFVILLNKFLDPGSVVREGEFARVLEAQGVFRRAQMLKDKVAKGDILDQESINQIVNLAKTYQTIANTKIHQRATQTSALAKRRGLDVESVILNPTYLTAPPALSTVRIPGAGGGAPAGAPSSSAAAANAILGK